MTQIAQKQFLVDAKGKKAAVIIDIKEYEHWQELIEDVQDLRFIAQHKAEETIPFEDYHRKRCATIKTDV